MKWFTYKKVDGGEVDDQGNPVMVDKIAGVNQRTRDRRNGESRRCRVNRHIEELAFEAHIDTETARKRLRDGNPLSTS